MIAADPLHTEHLVEVESVTARVQFNTNPLRNWQAAQNIIEKVSRHCHHFFRDKTTNVQFVTTETGNISTKILKNALAALNGYYNQEQLASVEQLKLAINDAISDITKWDLEPLFDDVVREDVAHE